MSNELHWEKIREDLHEKGYSVTSRFLASHTCDQLIKNYDAEGIYRKTVIMERHRFGLGEYKYFGYPLPDIIQIIRHRLFPPLSKIANEWMRVLRVNIEYPNDHQSFIETCHQNGQQKATPLILKYGIGGFNTLHQDLYGSIYFPLQLVLFLSDYGSDYEGGEFVLTEQVPRAQSKITVLKPAKGDAVIFATNYRPVKGKRGYYRANLKHGVSEVLAGNRYTLGVIFHDAIN